MNTGAAPYLGVMSLRKAAFYLVIAFLVMFVVKQPDEAADLLKATGENAGEWFAAGIRCLHNLPAQPDLNGRPDLMGGHDRYLAIDERVVSKIRRHPAAIAQPFFETLGVIVGSMVLGVAFSPSDGSDALDTVLGLLVFGFILRLGWRLWEWWIDRVVVTDKRLFEVSGILTRRVGSMPLAKVTDMTYHRSMAGRLFGYGELRLESPGQKQALARIAYLPKPDDFYRTVTSLVMAPTHRDRTDVADQVEIEVDDDTGPLPRVVV